MRKPTSLALQVSAFPVEAEILFPPLTYLRPTKKKQVIVIDVPDVLAAESSAEEESSSSSKSPGAFGRARSRSRVSQASAPKSRKITFTVLEVEPQL